MIESFNPATEVCLNTYKVTTAKQISKYVASP